MDESYEQLNVRIPAKLKDFVQKQSKRNYQTISGYIAMIIDNERKKEEKNAVENK